MTTVNTSGPSAGASAPDPAGPRTAANRVPPHSIDAETCVLGSMVLHADCIDIVVQIVQPDHFYRPAHQTIFQTLVEMRNDRKPIDLVSLPEELRRRKQLEHIGGIDYLVALVEGVPDASNAEYYSRVVRDKALLRKLIVAGTEMIHEAYETHEDALEALDRAEQQIFQIASQQIGDEAVELRGLLDQTFEALEANQGQLITGLASGYHHLDDLTSGFQKGDMIIMAARPSMGKTSMVLNMAEHMAIADKRPVVVFSMEMSKEQLAQRLLASYARYDLRRMRRGMISAGDWTQLQVAAGDLEQAPIFIDDSPLLTILQLRAKSRRLKAAHGINCVFVDYLQLMTYTGSARARHEQITEISRGIKALSRELEIPVVCAAQLNRGPADRERHRPRMSDLRDSGSIEQDADMVLLLHREDYYHQGEESYSPTGITELIVAKQRNGPTGVCELAFLPHCTRFDQAATRAYDEPQAHGQGDADAPF